MNRVEIANDPMVITPVGGLEVGQLAPDTPGPTRFSGICTATVTPPVQYTGN